MFRDCGFGMFRVRVSQAPTYRLMATALRIGIPVPGRLKTALGAAITATVLRFRVWV